MKTSLKDIAEELRLSKTTVSWVLSGRGNERGISQATQDRVKQCARRMNYQPNLLVFVPVEQQGAFTKVV